MVNPNEHGISYLEARDRPRVSVVTVKRSNHRRDSEIMTAVNVNDLDQTQIGSGILVDTEVVVISEGIDLERGTSYTHDFDNIHEFIRPNDLRKEEGW